MKVKELIEILQQSDPEKEVAIEFEVISGYNSSDGTDYAMIDSSDCKSKKDLFVINIEDYQSFQW